jgi:hypothetical protein
MTMWTYKRRPTNNEKIHERADYPDDAQFEQMKATCCSIVR